MRKLLIAASMLAGIYVSGQSISSDVEASAGASFTEDGYTIDWTVGELSTQTYYPIGGVVENYMLTEGFHQPNNFWGDYEPHDEAAGIEELAAECNVYPNPVSEKLYIEMIIEDEASYTAQIMDITGNIVSKSEFNTQKHEINMQHCNAGIYLLKVYNNQKIVKIIKITKTN